jgi:glycerophosphoryl diester phosphodiesterase
MITKVWAHRGASAYAPENTIEAFDLAIKQQADGVELDVQLTKDGEVVVIHDETINRVSYGEGYVKDYTLKELKQFNYNKTHPEFGKVFIPTLKEVYELLKPTNLTVNVELKTGIIAYDTIEEKVLEIEEKMGMQGRIIYSSFNHSSVMKLKAIKKEAKIGLLYADGFIDVPNYGCRLGADALHPALYHLQNLDLIKQCKEKNLALHVWTVNEQEHMIYLAQNQIDAIITNKPDLARTVVDHTL